ncbi:hypothetical protein GCM10022225_16020 [Plantactinospora mayteni]|uniref:Uncharacterized protein n=1 Tax=Plantactinospora mayteni TaxID=566021 RepID=A0ABQ4EHG4_9ACTN|nr:hypothetical protein [Plantactinospora mayteni]GIG93676.1 hypothetical protein Pma05_02490 [Plantactinospora mayteni]
MAAGQPGFDTAMRQVGELQVDVAHLERVSEYLRVLQDQIPHVRQTVQSAHEVVDSGGQHRHSALGSFNIDEVNHPEMDGLVRRLRRTHDAVAGNLADLESCLRDTAQAVAAIAKLYDTVEERNRLAAADVLKRLPR